MTELPAERKECTDMTFGLIRFEINSTSRRLLFTPPGTSICAQRAKSRTIEEKEQILDALRERLQERYFQNCDVTVPMDWVVVTVGKLILSKLWLMIHHPLQREDRGKGMSSDIRDRLFITSTEVIEFTRLLETNENTAKWGWLFHTHVQWHAVAYLLTELAIRGPSPEVDRAWAAVDVFNNTWVQEGSKSKSNIFWRPIKALMARAMAVREQQNQTKATQWMSDIQHGSSSTTISPTQQVASGITSNPGSLLGNTSPLDSIGQTALAFGMDLDIRDMYQNSSSGGFSSNIQVPQTISHPQEMTPAQRNLSDEDINQWLVTEPMPQVTSGQQNINFDWQGWDAIASDFQMGGTDGTAPSIFQYTDLL
ncbi:putative c6 transcription factor [Phaeomoniella chlamydospora]|uniref:Putative c6 transcription factor n=1 Tax=Phaeomoniella chlamydospora TaxID=158046 RepID=A0A0G2E5N9_PHACM|nr:putative c6 transcription factor [Phaeomoniella chlamydospora]